LAKQTLSIQKSVTIIIEVYSNPIIPRKKKNAIIQGYWIYEYSYVYIEII